jgi:hypothetical protein
MSMEQFTKANFRAETLKLIDQANEILQEYDAQGFTLTLRQLYYQFVARGIRANTDKEYGRLGKTITAARRDGRLTGRISKTAPGRGLSNSPSRQLNLLRRCGRLINDNRGHRSRRADGA